MLGQMQGKWTFQESTFYRSTSSGQAYFNFTPPTPIPTLQKNATRRQQRAALWMDVFCLLLWERRREGPWPGFSLRLAGTNLTAQLASTPSNTNSAVMLARMPHFPSIFWPSSKPGMPCTVQFFDSIRGLKRCRATWCRATWCNCFNIYCGDRSNYSALTVSAASHSIVVRSGIAPLSPVLSDHVYKN